ncbi:SusD/RagB family nutrient-binding outer membrane lipoprotein [Cytophagaceae bacterium YF14B1]|uniref:SusD/RagB family nutrient-binding outer membrane lipoprotein n=1 Tax=Xanthocytophaga flava TaxID=3048013 RepID=A0AAE3UBM0_9BACT|nr:SusD/RagB family nutrient-binding outer membrane lipoprotein [Xanthocytophaga flavus]MDJ1483889.1 SusD/RagB family nutrient-binding outer membrane lipoprotein [Xanthocytophaga flavus]
MKTSYYIVFRLVIVVMLTGSLSCTSNFDEINTNQTKVSTIGQAEIPYLFAKAQSSATLPYWYYQVGQNLFADQYAQYFACVATYFPSDRFVIRMDWLASPWSSQYTDVVPQLKSIFANTDSTSAENAIAKIWWVWSFHRWTDYVGPIPYFKAGEPASSVAYDSQDKIYDDFFKKLDESVAILKTKTGETPYGTFDLVYEGNISKWIKFANTLRLRLALRISKVDPTRAKSEAEAAVAGGLLSTSPADDALITRSTKGSDYNGLAIMSDWNEFRMSASMESVLKGYEDPRIGEYFMPTVKTGTYEGLRNGLTATQLTEPANSADYNSHVGNRWNSGTGLETSQNVMCTAEAYFLLAEGALNGWSMGGTAKDFYEKGIENSMKQWGITDAAAIAAYTNSTKTPIAPGDYLNSTALTNIPVKFNTTDTQVQREQIATQKWLAIFPDGFEGWAEYRRTRYPKLYPVPNSDNPDIPAGGVLRRIPFLDVEKQTNGPEVEKAKTLLGGEDKVTTPLWWDKN